MNKDKQIIFFVTLMVAIAVSVVIVLEFSRVNEIESRYAFGQSSAPYANCISMMMKGDFVQLSMDDDCNESEWTAAVQHYKANGYPNEDSYMDMIGSKFIELDSNKWIQDKADLDEYLKENK
jgi:hypothetical protein